MDQTLVIGLGNPDPALEETYHNIGLLAVQWLAEHLPDDEAARPFRTHKDLFAYTKAKKTIFIRPLVYMNESGLAVKEALHVFGATPKDIVVIHDDSDLTVGTFKLSNGGRSAGHKGIQSIIDHLKTQEFKRIRIGIREADEAHRKKAGDFVLSPITKKDHALFREVFEKISSSVLSSLI